MKLLVVMNNYPFPALTGSSIVAYNSMKGFSKQHDIDFICFKSLTKENVPLDFVNSFNLISKIKSNFKILLWIKYLFYMFRGIPSSISEYASYDMKRKVQEMLDSEKYDAIVLFEMSAIQHFPPSIYHKLIVNIEDPQSTRLYRMSNLPNWSAWQRLKFLLRIRLTATYENRVLHKMAKVLLLSKSDISDMQKQFGYKNLAYVPYCVEQQNITDIVEYKDRDRVIIFSGSMFHPSNIDGAIFLLKDIFPLILRQSPSAILMIVGADPDKRIYDAAAIYGEQVVITGKVDSVTDFIKRAKVSICPIRLKIGVQTKILEALSFGTPVVTTSAGNSGVNGVSGTHLWVEDSPPLLAKRVCELLDGDNWPNLSFEGRKFVTEQFSFNAGVEQLQKYLNALVEEKL